MKTNYNSIISGAKLERTLARLTCFPLPTLAVMNGHAYAGGFIMAMSHDFRIMKKDKTRLCLSEANLGGQMSNGFSQILMSTMSKQLFTKIQYGGVITAPEALEEGILNSLYTSQEEAEGQIK